MSSAMVSYGQRAILTAGNNFVCDDKIGTVTFSGPGITLEEKAKEFGLLHLCGRTYRAAVAYDVAFGAGKVRSNGKIWNLTDKTINVTCSYYSGNMLVATYKVTVKPLTFNRMLPDGAFAKVRHCDKIICQ